MSNSSRRKFLFDSAALAAGTAVTSKLAEPSRAAAPATGRKGAPPFRSRWHQHHNRVWAGAEYWTNPLQDWRLQDGRLACINDGWDRNVHLLTRQLGAEPGDFETTVRIRRDGGEPLARGRGSAGFRIGIQGPLREYRNNVIFGQGLDAGITAEGDLFLVDPGTASTKIERLGEQVELTLRAEPAGDRYRLTLIALAPDDQEALGQVQHEVAAERLVGNVALVANFGQAARGRGARRANASEFPGTGRFAFEDWRVSGSKVEAHDDRRFGPIMFSQYSLSGSVLTMTAQMAPVGADDSQPVTLEVRTAPDEAWRTVGEAAIHPEARTATIRIPAWDDSRDYDYRLVWQETLRDGSVEQAAWQGRIRRDPVDQPVVTVANISCNIHAAFPNSAYVEHAAKSDPDLLAFVGDQFYESSGGYGVTRAPLDAAILDYLRKWYIHGWTWRRLLRDRPSVALPDDHDVYQGNIWGESGAPRQETQESGGYGMPPAWVNVVHRTQTSHHPPIPDPAPIRQDISVYYGPMVYGRISFAILADRMFKTGPEGVVPSTRGRGDHVVDPDFDPKTADVPGAELLGERQMKFLRDWITDWRGADMKCVLSQTIFTGMATTHGGQRQRLRADYDANGWPQTPRNEALREIRKAFAIHLAGDQHLPAVVHYGIDEHEDAGVAFAGPAVNTGYPRWWEPEQPGANRRPGAPENTGRFQDAFGHPLTVMAVANPSVNPRKGVLEQLQDKSSGLGLVRFDKQKQSVTIECWPLLVDPTEPTSRQFPGWPITVPMLRNYARQPVAHLPTLNVIGVPNPVIHVLHSSGELVYSLRVKGQRFQPHVFAPGQYVVRVSDPDAGLEKRLDGLTAAVGNRETVDVRF